MKTRRLSRLIYGMIVFNVLLFGANTVVSGAPPLCPPGKPLRACAALCSDGSMDCCSFNCSADCTGCIVH